MPEQCLHHDENDSGQMRDAEGANVHVRYARQVCRLAGNDVACYGGLW